MFNFICQFSVLSSQLSLQAHSRNQITKSTNNQNINIIIIEDEKPAARLLQRKIEKLGLDVKTMLHSVEEAINWFNSNQHPDLIFLDIQLSDGLSFEIFEQIEIKSAVVFTAAYDE